MTDPVAPQLYLVSPPRFEPESFALQVRAALQGGTVACLQLWMPDASEDEIRTAATLVLAEVKSHDTAFLLNGNAKLAAYLGCDGVHLDMPDVKSVKAAKKRPACRSRGIGHPVLVGGDDGSPLRGSWWPDAPESDPCSGNPV